MDDQMKRELNKPAMRELRIQIDLALAAWNKSPANVGIPYSVEIARTDSYHGWSVKIVPCKTEQPVVLFRGASTP